MNALFSRWLPAATLATWSGVLLYFFLSGRVVAFLAPMFRPYVLIAGVVLAVMAALLAFFPADSSCCASDQCGHSLAKSSAGKLLTFLVLLLPITLTALVSPDSFGKAVIENRGIDTTGATLAPRKSGPLAPADMPLPTKDGAPVAAATPKPLEREQSADDYLQRTPEGYIVAEVLDLLYAAQDTVLRKDFEGKTVQLVGQILPDKTTAPTAPKRFKAVRMFMTCCAADARPVATLVETETLPDFPEMTWVKVTGTAMFPVENGRRTAVVKASRVEKSEPPAESMLY